MSTTESQIAQSEIPRPKGWNDEYYQQFVEVVTCARQVEELGGSAGIVALFTEPEANEVADAAFDKGTVNWSKGTGFKANIKSTGWGPIKTKIVVELTTGDGHTATFSITTPLANLVWKPLAISGNLGFNDWSALMGGANYITIYSNSAPLTVNNVVQGEFKTLFPIRIPGLSLKSSFIWDA